MSYSLYDTIFLNTGNLITSTFRDDIVVLENTKETGTTDKDCRLVIRSNEDGESDIHLENLNGSTRNGWRIMNYTQGEYFSIGYRVGYTTSVSDYNFGWNEYLTVKTNGNVGIGTLFPAAKLDVRGDIFNTGQFLNNASQSATTPAYSFYFDNDTGMFRATTNELGFSTGGTERVRIASSGYVGIGTTNPLTNLSITPYSGGPKITLNDSGSTTTHYGFGISAYQLNYDVANLNASHVFYAGGKNGSGATELMRIKGNGNVGIGTTNPTSTLQVGHTGTTTDTSLHVIAGDSYTATIAAYGASQGTGQLFLGQSSLQGGGIIYNGNDLDAFSTADTVSFYRRYNGTDTEVFYYGFSTSTVNFIGDCYIKNSGEVLRLYETNSPTSKRTFIGFYPEDSTGGRKAYLGFTDTATNDFTILNQYTDGDTRIGAGNGIKMLITSEGDVGIGTNNPSEKLHVNGNVNINGTISYNTKQETHQNNASLSYTNTDQSTNLKSVTISSDGIAHVHVTGIVRVTTFDGTAGASSSTEAFYFHIRKNSTPVTATLVGHRMAKLGNDNDIQQWRPVVLSWSGVVESGDQIHLHAHTIENDIVFYELDLNVLVV